MEQLIAGSVMDANGDDVPVSTFTGKDKTVGIYFSAHWCPPCKQFTPILAEFYKKIKAEGKGFEILFVSSDRDEASFMEYFKEMPWLAVKFGSEAVGNLKSKYKIKGIPTLVIINGETFETITENGRAEVMKGDLKL